MFLVTGGRTDGGESFHVFVETPPPASKVPTGCKVLGGVKLTAHPLSDDPQAPTVSTVLYRDPTDPSHFHYLLAPEKAGGYRRVASAPFVYPSWDEFAEMHPGEIKRMGG